MPTMQLLKIANDNHVGAIQLSEQDRAFLITILKEKAQDELEYGEEDVYKRQHRHRGEQVAERLDPGGHEPKCGLRMRAALRCRRAGGEYIGEQGEQQAVEGAAQVVDLPRRGILDEPPAGVGGVDVQARERVGLHVARGCEVRAFAGKASVLAVHGDEDPVVTVGPVQRRPFALGDDPLDRRVRRGRVGHLDEVGQVDERTGDLIGRVADDHPGLVDETFDLAVQLRDGLVGGGPGPGETARQVPEGVQFPPGVDGQVV